jgi:recombination protein RecT
MMSKELVKAAPPTPQALLKDQLEKNKGSIAQVLPKGFTVDRLIKVLLVAAVKNEKLYQCSQTSIVKSIMDAAQLGFELGSPLGHAYAVPFFNKDKNCHECQLIVGYKGLIKLAVGDGQLVRKIEARVVYENDEFNVEYGTRDELIHRPNFDNPGEMIAVYAVATMPHGEKQFEVMTWAQVEAIRKRSKQADSGPWRSDYDEMARKTVAKKLIKYLPISVDSQEKIERSEAIEIGEDISDPLPPEPKSNLANKVRANAEPPAELDKGNFGEPADDRAPPPREDPPAPKAAARPEPPQREIIDAEAAVHVEPPAQTDPPRIQLASDEEVVEICKRVFGCATEADVAKIGEELNARPSSGLPMFTKEQGGRIRTTIESKRKTLQAAAKA